MTLKINKRERSMKRLILAAALAVGLSFTAASPALARNYDCSKPANATKAACKASAKAAPAKATPAKAAPTKMAAKTSAAAVDCTKLMNKARAACRKPAAATPAKTAAAPAAAAPRSKTAAADNKNPAGATALCKDGTYSHSKTHSGSCSGHHGVAKWL